MFPSCICIVKLTFGETPWASAKRTGAWIPARCKASTAAFNGWSEAASTWCLSKTSWDKYKVWMCGAIFYEKWGKPAKQCLVLKYPDQWCWIAAATVPAWGAGVAAAFNGIVHVGRLNNCLIREGKRYTISVSMVFSASYLLKDRPSLAPNSNRWMGLISWPIDRQQCCQSFEQKPGRGTTMVRVWAIFVCNA